MNRLTGQLMVRLRRGGQGLWSHLSWLVLSLVIVVCDYLTGPSIQFPILYILPVAWATWSSGARSGYALAALLPLARVYSSTLWHEPHDVPILAANFVIRLSVLCTFVYLGDLAIEGYVLRGCLPICAFCKRIRDGSDTWHHVEEYVRAHSGAEFTHGFCPECALKHYGIVVPGKEPPA